MALLMPNVGEQKMLEALVNKTAPQDQILRLFQNNYTPVEGSATGNFTEATFTGYAQKSLSGATWGAASAGDPSSIAYPEQTFTSTAGSQSQTIYGYYILQTTSTVLLWAERFTDGPYTIVNNGDAIKVTPTITLE